MTNGSILPSIGPSPSEFRRPSVPENLRPQLASVTEKQSARQTAFVRPDETRLGRSSDLRDSGTSQQAGPVKEGQASQASAGREVASQPPPSRNLGGPSAVALQVKEGQGQALDGSLTEEEKATVERLRERDREVRAHENAHASVGRGYTGAPSFEFSRGPDGVQYAVGGQVDIDVSPVADDPRATITKMEVVRSAALAPARPSGQDKAVAAAASAAAREASAELASEKKQEQDALLSGSSEGSGASNNLEKSGESGTFGASEASGGRRESSDAGFGASLTAQAGGNEPASLSGGSPNGALDGQVAAGSAFGSDPFGGQDAQGFGGSFTGSAIASLSPPKTISIDLLV